MSTFIPCDNPYFNEFVAPLEKRDYEQRNALHLLGLEITGLCGGSCAYCFSSFNDFTNQIIPKEKALELIDEGMELDIRSVALIGGDALARPNWYVMVRYAVDQGLSVGVGTSFLISKKMATQLTSLNIDFLCSHIDTIDPEAYAQVHTNPRTLPQKIQWLWNLLEAGFPPERIVVLITLTKPIIPTIEQTLDWHFDEMGLRYATILSVKSGGFGADHRSWEPSSSDFRRAHEYRAGKMGHQWLRIGVGGFGKFLCRTYIQVHTDGNVSPCNTLRELSVGNVYQESLSHILGNHRDYLLHHYEIKGKCGDCENNDVCLGCRANAYYYLGDVQASDPKCWLNPEAPEYCYAEARTSA
jgi:radical SAM protein with 4Fe4S-binding SPASM domain